MPKCSFTAVDAQGKAATGTVGAGKGRAAARPVPHSDLEDAHTADGGAGAARAREPKSAAHDDECIKRQHGCTADGRGERTAAGNGVGAVAATRG